jgi:hypothetical protein
MATANSNTCRAAVPRMTPSAGGSVVLDFQDPETLKVRSVVPSGATTNHSIRIRKLSAACSQRCSQRALALKMTTLQATGLPLRVSHEGLEPPTPVRHLVDRQGITQIIYLIAARCERLFWFANLAKWVCEYLGVDRGFCSRCGRLNNRWCSWFRRGDGDRSVLGSDQSRFRPSADCAYDTRLCRSSCI